MGAHEQGERGPRGDQGSFGHPGPEGKVGEQGIQGERGKDAPIHPWRWRALSVWIVLFTTLVLFTVYKSNNTSHDAHKAAITATDAAKAANLASRNIQSQRKESIFRGCVEQNQRHDNTIKKLNEIIQGLPEAQRARAEASKSFTITLINQLTPKQNCKMLVNKSVKPPPAPLPKKK